MTNADMMSPSPAPREQVIAHIDMDAFFASIEVLDDPLLKGKPVIVGGGLKRGVVSAAGYEARKFGIHSAMPIFEAKRRCPQGIFLPVRMKRYKEISLAVMACLRKFSPLVEPVSVDEAYIDLTGTGLIFGKEEEAARKIKKEVSEKTSLICSIGVSTCKFIAKIASDLNKPDGLTIIPPEQVREFLDTLSIKKVPGIGKKTGEQLVKMGILYLGDVNQYPPDRFYKKFGKLGIRLVEFANGIDKSRVVPRSSPKSISSENTLAEDTDDLNILKKYLIEQAETVARSLRKKGLKGRTMILKIKHTNFRLVTRSVTLEYPTQLARVIYRENCKLLDIYKLFSKVRLVGLGISNLEPVDTPEQLNLFKKNDDLDKKWEKAEKALDKIVNRFGDDTIKRGTLLDE